MKYMHFPRAWFREKDICSNSLPLRAARSSERTEAVPGGFLLIKIKDESMISRKLSIYPGEESAEQPGF